MVMRVCAVLEDQWPIGNTDMEGFHWHHRKHCFLPNPPRREKQTPLSSTSTKAGKYRRPSWTLYKEDTVVYFSWNKRVGVAVTRTVKPEHTVPSTLATVRSVFKQFIVNTCCSSDYASCSVTRDSNIVFISMAFVATVSIGARELGTSHLHEP